MCGCLRCAARTAGTVRAIRIASFALARNPGGGLSWLAGAKICGATSLGTGRVVSAAAGAARASMLRTAATPELIRSLGRASAYEAERRPPRGAHQLERPCMGDDAPAAEP